MFIVPVGVEYEYERTAWATRALVAANVLVFLFGPSSDSQKFLDLALPNHGASLAQHLSAAFLHVDVLHLLGNMLYLAVFGRYVEARVGWWRFLLVYLACVWGSDLVWALDERRLAGLTYSVGSSGAIAGLMGFTVVAAPRAGVYVAGPWLSPSSTRPGIPAVLYLGGWIGFQLLLYAMTDSILETAFSAHVGGFLAGVGLAFLVHAELLRGTRWHVERSPGGGSLDEAALARTVEKWKARAEASRARRAARRSTPPAPRPGPLSQPPLELPPLELRPAEPARERGSAS